MKIKTNEAGYHGQKSPINFSCSLNSKIKSVLKQKLLKAKVNFWTNGSFICDSLSL